MDVAAERQVIGCEILSVCSSLKFRLLIYVYTLQEWKHAFPSGLCKDIKD